MNEKEIDSGTLNLVNYEMAACFQKGLMMNKQEYEEAKKLLEQITKLVDEGGITDEEKEKLEINKAQLSGQLLSIWWPFDLKRRLIMIVLFLIGLYGVTTGNAGLIWAWLAMIFFSPRIMGEVAFRIGQLAGLLR